MEIVVAKDRLQMGAYVADCAAKELCRLIDDNGSARLLIATGSSQFEVLDALSRHDEVDWSCVTGFHLDEYIGISPDHPASFCGYLKTRFVDRVPLKAFHYLHGNGNAEETMHRVGNNLKSVSTGHEIDVALVGIGENGHLAFNDPPADFLCDDPYIIVELDQACRLQQVGEGWFPNLESVPKQAISMSIKQIMKSSMIFCSVPDQRKANAVRQSVEGAITPEVPASILQNHPQVTLILDLAAASELSGETLSGAKSL